MSKTFECPFCETAMTPDSNEITINQILKLTNFFSVAKHSTKDLDDTLKKSHFYQSLLKTDSET